MNILIITEFFVVHFNDDVMLVLLQFFNLRPINFLIVNQSISVFWTGISDESFLLTKSFGRYKNRITAYFQGVFNQGWDKPG